MSRADRAKRTVLAAARYARLRARQAYLRNDRYARLNWEQVEAVLLDAYFGSEPHSARFRRMPRVIQVAARKPRTRAQVEMMQHPLRRVVRVEPRESTNGHRRGFVKFWREVLECGHHVNNYVGRVEISNTTRRRCPECKHGTRVLPFAARARAAHA